MSKAKASSPEATRTTENRSADSAADLAPVVCLACEDYWYHPKRSRRHYMERLAERGRRVLFVNSIGMQAPKLGESDFASRVFRKLKSWMRWLRRPEPDANPTFWVGSPISIPLFGWGGIRKINAAILPFQIRLMVRRAGIKRPILWIGNPAMGDLKEKLGERWALLHNSDKYAAYAMLEGNDIAAQVENLARNGAGIISASMALAEEMKEYHERSYHLAHGVDADHFTRAREPEADLLLPEELADIPRPRIGFVGTVDHILDRDLIQKTAEERPEFHQVFIGPVASAFDELRALKLPNLHFLGQKPYEKIPTYLRGFDAVTMPVVDDEWARYCNHLKLREYLLAGRPSVVIPFDEAGPFEDVSLMRQAGPDLGGWLTALDEAVEQGRRILDPDTGAWLENEETTELRGKLAVIARGTWEARTDDLEAIFAELEADQG